MAFIRLPLPRAVWLGLVYAAGILASTPGCATIRVHRTDAVDLFSSFRLSALRGGELSARTVQTLRRYDLDHFYLDNPGEAVARLHAEACKDPQPDLVFALAEINFQRAQQAEKRDHPGAIASYYLSAGYAYHFLFDHSQGRTSSGALPPAVFDPRFRLACDLYNASLAKCIAAAQRIGQLDARSELRVPTPDGRDFFLSVVHSGFVWKPEEFGPLLLAEDYKVEGLTNYYHTYGLGVPLIATRSKAVPPCPYFPPTACFPVTAFFRFEGGLTDLGQCRCGRLELYNPLAYQAVDVRGHTVPLETDLTTPLGYFLAESKLDQLAYTGFVWGDSLRGRTGVHMLAPYQPGKIPVVLVHGLLSSPLTWAPVFNDLQADPVLRDRFQFWYYFYPTGEPYLTAAADLRNQLAHLRDELDPAHKDPALDRMVFAGHSMGGLVSRLLTVDGGSDFWQLVSNRPLEELRLKDDTRAELEQTFFFKRQDCVTRVVFFATPHRGSKLSPSTLGRLAVRLVHLPHDLMATTQDIATENPDLVQTLDKKPLETSVDLLAPDAPALKLLAARARPKQVHYHSIIGVLKKKVYEAEVETWLSGDYEPGDGVVPYRSAHLDGIDSELKVDADHSHVHHHPLAILELRRILLEHLREAEASGEILPVSTLRPDKGDAKSLPLTSAKTKEKTADSKAPSP
jgi:pimeloyl-ACP methyl ester carboxylesterase